ncbi:hypothetical protein BHE74_00053598 [Ensete ventricosum]|nr:hypothetical protein BHE74_00053598 [Ensete ventricosum]
MVLPSVSGCTLIWSYPLAVYIKVQPLAVPHLACAHKSKVVATLLVAQAVRWVSHAQAMVTSNGDRTRVCHKQLTVAACSMGHVKPPHVVEGRTSRSHRMPTAIAIACQQRRPSGRRHAERVRWPQPCTGDGGS